MMVDIAPNVTLKLFAPLSLKFHLVISQYVFFKMSYVSLNFDVPRKSYDNFLKIS
jgi:hypothetical protein